MNKPKQFHNFSIGPIIGPDPAVSRGESLAMWLAPDLMFGCVIFIVYFGIIKENTRILSFGLRAHIYYSVLCLLRIVYMALKLFACTEHMRSQGICYCLVYVVERSRVFVVWYLLNMAIGWFFKVNTNFMKFDKKKIRIN